jgi:16S rRNA (cytidine1402-2'-O)-methyltransferase
LEMVMMWQNSYDGSPSLYLVPTPIGNLEDMTFRSVEVLKNVDVIFSEDTRVTLILLNHFDIKKKLISLHDHNEEMVKDKVLDYLKDNKNVAIVTDRGTPIISDPGYKTVKYVSDNGYNVIGLPGACAFVPAFIVSGLPSEHFLFYGFLNSKDSKMREELNNLKNFENTIIFYEAPHRLIKCLRAILDVFGDRYVSISKEISKLYESVYRGNLSTAIKSFDVVKGEYVIVVDGFKRHSNDYTNLSVVEHVNMYIKSGLYVMDAIKMVAKERNIPKGEIYKEYHIGDKK